MEELARRVAGPAGAPRLVLVHGFGQTGRCWGPVEDDLAGDHELVLVDAPGHGCSADVRLPFDGTVDAIGAAGGPSPATYVGYSMGGRCALALAVAHPELVERVVLIGASPGLADPGARAERVASDEALARRIESIGVDDFVDEWLALPMFAGLDDTTRFVAQRRTNPAAGLASSLRSAGTGAQPSLWGSLPEVACPVLLVTGADDAKFTAIAAAMAASLPSATHVTIFGAGHTAHLEQPTAFLAELRPWLARTRPSG